jgi:sec-independent protein translocase protein TatA
MFEGLLQPMHLLVILGIALMVFGPKKLPELGKGLGEGIRGFRSAMKENAESTDAELPKPDYARMSDPVLVACLSFSPRSEQGEDLRFNIAC